MRAVRAVIFDDGEPCCHVGCSHHASHPCETCGRTLMRGEALVRMDLLSEKERQRMKGMLKIQYLADFVGP